MRIISGSAGGRRLVAPESGRIRPTSDRVREALFSILGDLDNAVVVDGFSGTGALGCEALSRGARFCYFFDRSAEAIALIEENLEIIGARSRALVYRGDFISQLNMIDEDPDLWLLDPPYHKNLCADALNAMHGAASVTDGALVVVEQEASEDRVDAPGFHLEDRRVYGRTRLCLYRRI